MILNYIVNLNVDNENKISHCLLNDVICNKSMFILYRIIGLFYAKILICDYQFGRSLRQCVMLPQSQADTGYFVLMFHILHL